jgi:hypothetical protein
MACSSGWIQASIIDAPGASLTVVCLLVSIAQQHLFAAAAAVVEQWRVICGALNPDPQRPPALLRQPVEAQKQAAQPLFVLSNLFIVCTFKVGS